jgi:probable rRNA maturation factor
MKLKLSLTATPSAKKLYPKYTTWKSGIATVASAVISTELPDVVASTVSIIFQTDDELLELNKRILDHDYYTDIITFELEHTDTLTETEIYISLDRATENAERFGSDLRSEVMRLVIHGLLHVAGYSDKSPVAKKRMQKRERFFLSTIEE